MKDGIENIAPTFVLWYNFEKKPVVHKKRKVRLQYD